MLKQDIRILFRKKRVDVKQEEVSNYSELIGQQLLPVLRSCKKLTYLHTFLPAEKKREVNTFNILRLIRPSFPFLNIVVPKVETGDRQLSHLLLTENSRLVPSHLGIPEPESGEAILPEKIDVVLVPMLACDKSGNRVGYGGGFYDSFLSDCRTDTLKIGVSFFDPIDHIEDTGPHDVRLDLCITPGRTWRFSGV